MTGDESESDADRKGMADSTVDVVGTVEPDDADLYIDAGPLHVGFSDGVSGGLRVIQDGDFLAISQGVDYEDGDRATVGHSLTPVEAREFADQLLEAADDAEEAQAYKETNREDRQSLLKRVVEGIRP